MGDPFDSKPGIKNSLIHLIGTQNIFFKNLVYLDLTAVDIDEYV